MNWLALAPLALLASACATSTRTTSTGGDMKGAASSDLGRAHDLGHDLTMNLAAPHDFAGQTGDLTASEDLVAASDLAGANPRDLAIPPDLTIPQDSAIPRDLAIPPDFATPQDFAMPLDFAKPPPPPDLANPCKCAHHCLLGCTLGCCGEDVLNNSCTPNFFCVNLGGD